MDAPASTQAAASAAISSGLHGTCTLASRIVYSLSRTSMTTSSIGDECVTAAPPPALLPGDGYLGPVNRRRGGQVAPVGLDDEEADHRVEAAGHLRQPVGGGPAPRDDDRVRVGGLPET